MMKPQTPIATLIETYKPMCTKKDANGMLPLHYVCAGGASELVIRRLLEAYPAAASVASFSERLPLHWGAEARLEPPALKLILDAYPAGVGMRDSYGCLPKDLASRGVQAMLSVDERPARR